MPSVVVARRGDSAAWFDLAAIFAQANPGLTLDAILVDGEAHVDSVGTTYLWPARPGLTLPGGSPLDPGDLLVVGEGDRVTLSGTGTVWAITDLVPPAAVQTRVVHLRDVPDTSGGCATDRDAFRRCALTWQDTGEGDGVNRVNSHVVAIVAQGSRTHYHPAVPAHGHPQHELYLVLEPTDWGLDLGQRPGLLHTYPYLGDLSRVDTIALAAGDAVLISPGTGHRGVDCLVNVVTVPGFKPGNELYLDAAIAAAGPELPYNPAYAEAVRGAR